MSTAELALEQVYCSDEIPNRALMLQAFFDGKRATVVTRSEACEVVKMRLDCSSPGAQGKLRLIFVFIKMATTVRFIELYSKNDKSREDSQRIKRYLELSSARFA